MKIIIEKVSGKILSWFKNGKIYPCDKHEVLELLVYAGNQSETNISELTAQIEASEAEYHALKSVDRKRLDNYALSLIDELNTLYPSLNIVSTDTVESVTTRAIQQNVTFTDVSKLLTLKEVIGNSRLPAQPHTIEET